MKRFLSKSLSRSAESESEENPSSQSSAYEKRRAQVRKAQRKHRDRKATYLKALEIEVVNLRTDNQNHKDEVAFLRGVLQEYNINPPPWSGPSKPTRSPSASPVISKPPPNTGVNTKTSTLTVSKESGLGQPLRVAFPQGSYALSNGQLVDTAGNDMNGMVSSSPSTNGDVGALTTSMQGMGNDFNSDLVNSNMTTSNYQNQQEPNTQDAIDLFVGVDWVLALEHPCMTHFSMILPPFGTHSHMASHSLLLQSPSNLQSQPSAPGSWQVPSASINSLLALSKSFSLQGELTPVQAWYRLKEDPRFGRIRQSQLDMLRVLLMGDVKCYGFGAVIDEEIWMLAVEEVLSLGTG